MFSCICVKYLALHHGKKKILQRHRVTRVYSYRDVYTFHKPVVGIFFSKEGLKRYRGKQ